MAVGAVDEINLMQSIVTIAGSVVASIGAVWTWGRLTGRGEESQKDISARLDAQSARLGALEVRVATVEREEGVAAAHRVAQSDRLSRLEERHDRVDDKLGAMSERLAQLPTRNEMIDLLQSLTRAREG